MPVNLDVELSERGLVGHVKVNGVSVPCTRLLLDIVPNEPITAKIEVVSLNTRINLDADDVTIIEKVVATCPECGTFILQDD